MVRDFEIRKSLREKLAARHAGEADTRIVEELGLCQGEARVDLAVVNGRLHGYEIKSESDTLTRLPAQVRAYNQALEYMTIVVSPSHLEKAISLIPSWWGVVRAEKRGYFLCLVESKKPRPNPSLEPVALAQFLWRDEALQVLVDHGLAAGVLRKPRRALWVRLAKEFSVDELGAIVRQKLKERRGDWRSLAP